MKSVVLIAALAASAGVASATSFDLLRDSGPDRLIGGVETFGSNTQAGHIGLRYAVNPAPGTGGGQFKSGSFATFCIELDQNAGNGNYTINRLADAPDPTGGPTNPNGSNSYGNAIAARIKIAVRAGIDANWIASDLSLISVGNSAADLLLERRRMAVIQAAIWEAIFDTGSFDFGLGDVRITNTDLQTLWNQLDFNNSGQVAGLRAITSGQGQGNRQDMLYVVPLPPAAFAGLATLVGVAGVARLRRR
ncbi:hypothetical protein [Nodularia spumigena]|uniref:hypothetical protein n=1 Tax=Nodularia spumigena TaxID=70799 RepID=UPI002B21ED8B|nr:hypothetical protein [Nodularia spumigena]MEA5612316.1 hypothetical protein [Nodularia spumigena UHCC 0040]